MAESKYVIEDLQNQVKRLSEERALFYALAKEQEASANKHQENVRILAGQLESANERINELEGNEDATQKEGE